MIPLVFNNGTVIDAPLQELITDSLRFVVRAYKDDAVRNNLKGGASTLSTDEEEAAYAKLAWLLRVVCCDSYLVSKLACDTQPILRPDSTSSMSDSQKLVLYLQETPKASLRSLFSLLTVYQDVIKYEKTWRDHYGCSVLSYASLFLTTYLSNNINEVGSTIYPGQRFSLFIPPRFLDLDMDVDEILEGAVAAGLTTRYQMRNRKDFFYGQKDYWIFSCLITPELTEQFLFEYLTLDRKPTYFSGFRIQDLLFTGWNHQLRLNPKVQRARAENLHKRLTKINSYHIEKLAHLVWLIDDINVFAIDLMALQLETDAYQRAKASAEAILVSEKFKWQLPSIGLVTPSNVLEKYKEHVKQEDASREGAYLTAYRSSMIEAITAIQNTLMNLDNIRKNQQYFGYSEWVWDINE